MVSRHEVGVEAKGRQPSPHTWPELRGLVFGPPSNADRQSMATIRSYPADPCAHHQSETRRSLSFRLFGMFRLPACFLTADRSGCCPIILVLLLPR